jgi:hypothetical protein
LQRRPLAELGRRLRTDAKNARNGGRKMSLHGPEMLEKYAYANECAETARKKRNSDSGQRSFF